MPTLGISVCCSCSAAPTAVRRIAFTDHYRSTGILPAGLRDVAAVYDRRQEAYVRVFVTRGAGFVAAVGGCQQYARIDGHRHRYRRSYPSFTKYFPGNCFTRRFNSSRSSVDETVPLGRSAVDAISSIEVSVS